jgi:hypothetical protein
MIEDDCNWFGVEANKDKFLQQSHSIDFTKQELLKLKSWE